MAITTPATLTATSGRLVILTATSDATECIWKQRSGPAVALTSTGLVARFTAPLTAGPMSFRATQAGNTSDTVVKVTRTAKRPGGTNLWTRIGREIAADRDKYADPFATASIWNVPIGDKATYTALSLTAPGQGYAEDESILIFAPLDPLRSIVDRGYRWPWTSGTSVPGTATGQQVKIPDSLVIPPPGAGEYPNNATAGLQTDGTALEFQYTVRPTVGSNISISDGVRHSLAMDGIGRDPLQYGAHGGSGMTCIGGTLRVGELTVTAPIRHALAVAMNMRKWGTQNGGGIVNGYRWPAIAADAYYNGVNGYGVRGSGGKPGVGMGSLLAIPNSVDLSTLGFETPQGTKLAQAYKDYGAYVVDDSDDAGGTLDCHLLCVERGVKTEYPAIDSSAGAPNASAAFRRDMDKIFTRLAVVSNSGSSAVGGGGAPRAPLARPLVGEPAFGSGVVGVNYVGVGASTSAAVAAPVKAATVSLASTVGGHYNLVIISTMSVAAVDPGVIVPPDWWTVFGTAYAPGTNGVRLTVIGKRQGEFDPGTINLSWTNNSAYVAQSVAYAGVDVAFPSKLTAKTVAGASYPTGDVDIQLGSWLVTIASCQKAGTWTMPDTTRSTVGVPSSVNFGISDTNGEVAPGLLSRSATFSVTTGTGAAAIIALRVD